MTTEIPLIPQSREAEEALLGAVLINPEIFLEVSEFLQAGDFYLHRHRWIWETFQKLNERRAPLDFLTVTDELEKAGHLAEVGGPAYLTALINAVPTSLHAEGYARLVEESALRRRLLEAANQVAKTAYQEGLEIEIVLDEAEKAIFAVSERCLTRTLQPVSKIAGQVYEQVAAASQGNEAGLSTGFYALDRLLGGLQPADLVIVAGRPGMGKTGFLLSLARHATGCLKKHLAVFSLEMSNAQLVQRLFSQETGIDSQRLRTGKLLSQEWVPLAQAVERVTNWRLFLDDTPALTPSQLRTRCRKLHMEYGLDLIMVDYLQLMSGGTRTENRTQEVSLISRNLKILARELNVPIIAAAQLSRAVEQRADKRPTLADLRESGALEQDSDLVLFLYRPEMYGGNEQRHGVAEVIVAKHRKGPVGQVELAFQAHLAKFDNLKRGADE
ncbi:MAG: replicative DNA helicase [Anaerolineales bacterium]|nr:replicative DNA helicase [Anaerolineales bacterium]